MRHGRLFLAVLLPLAGCGLAPPARNFVGPVTARPGNPACQTSRGTLTVRGRQFQFEPNEGVLVIQGGIAPDGHLRGEDTTRGVDHHPFTLRFEGTLAGDEVTGTLTTPRCTFDVALRPPERGLLKDLLRR